MQEFLNRISGNRRSFTPELNCFKNALKLGPSKRILVAGPSGIGLTAIMLDLCKEYLVKDYIVIYFDCGDSAHDYRIPDFKDLPLIVLRPTGSDGILETLTTTYTYLDKNLSNKLVIALDSAYLMSEDGYVKFKGALEKLSRYIGRVFPQATIIVSKRTERRTFQESWSAVLEVKYLKAITEDREVYGHLCSIAGPLGLSKVFIDYRYGRINRPYDYGSAMINQGKESSSIFEYNGEKYKGIWNLSKNVEYL